MKPKFIKTIYCLFIAAVANTLKHAMYFSYPGMGKKKAAARI